VTASDSQDRLKDERSNESESNGRDREYHLRRVCAAWPRVISQRSIERLARLLSGKDAP
jgi:hypothetical protein